MKNEKSSNKNVLKKVATYLLCVLVIVLSFTGGYFSRYIFDSKNTAVVHDIVSLMDRVGYIYDPITGEEREISSEEIADAIVNAFLDDYSVYYTAEEYENKVSKGKGNYRGVGVQFYYSDTQVDVIVGNSPADQAGLVAGDIILSGKTENEEEKTKFNTATEIINYLKNCGENSEIFLEYERDGEIYNATLKARPYVASYVNYFDSEVRYSFLASGTDKPVGVERTNSVITISDSKVAYIRLDAFEGDASKQMKEALSFMKERGRTKLILDLRNNGGGYMDTATEIASYFINNGGKRKSVVAYAVGKTGTETFSTPKNNFFPHIEKAVVLANEHTASASECLIGALVHYKEVVNDFTDIILEQSKEGVAKTYGKGIMQTTYKLISGGALKLTTAKIYWPDKTTSIHGVGVTNGTSAKSQDIFSVALNKLS